MATKKKELLEQEMLEQEIVPMDEMALAFTETETLESEEDPGDSCASEEQMASSMEETEDAMDLNELLESMEEDAENDLDTSDEELLYGASEADLLDASSSPDLSTDLADMALPDTEHTEDEMIELIEPADKEAAPAKPKRTVRKKKSEPAPEDTTEPVSDTPIEDVSSITAADVVSAADHPLTEAPAPDVSERADAVPLADVPAKVQDTQISRRPEQSKNANAPVLTIESRGEVETAEAREDVVWHEIHNAYRTRKILTGQLGGIEQTDTGKTIAIADYKGFRIVIPLKEMMINLGRTPSGQEYTELMLRQNKILGNMLGAEIDFIVRGIDSKSRSVVASRREAMLKKRQIFYLDTDASGMYRIYDGRIVQARVIAVAEKVIRVEIFGVECSIMARDLAWDWIGDAHERFSVGDQVLVRVLNVRRDSLEDIGIKADIKSVSQNTNHDNLKKCRIQSKYAGKVTDVHKGVVYIRLSNGVNAVAHSCYDYRTPGKKDDVSFAVTRIDEERGVAVGIITRIIRQNL